MGSKSKIAKHIIPIIQGYIDEYNPKYYIEPFCGGCNVIDKIKHNKKLAGDKQFYLIELLNNLDKFDRLPKDFVSKEHYSEVRNAYNSNNKDKLFENWYIGAIGFLASYGGRFFDGGYAGFGNEKGRIRNYYDECKRNLGEQIPNLKNIKFYCKDYLAWSKAENSIIYCDPPYKDTKQYNSSKGFDHDKFWRWCRYMSKKNIVIISEERAPDDFEVLWQKDVKRTLNAKNKFSKTEKLFKYRGIN